MLLGYLRMQFLDVRIILWCKRVQFFNRFCLQFYHGSVYILTILSLPNFLLKVHFSRRNWKRSFNEFEEYTLIIRSLSCWLRRKNIITHFHWIVLCWSEGVKVLKWGKAEISISLCFTFDFRGIFTFYRIFSKCNFRGRDGIWRKCFWNLGFLLWIAWNALLSFCTAPSVFTSRAWYTSFGVTIKVIFSD